MDFDKLDTFSRRFAEVLFAVYPQWKPFGKVGKSDDRTSSHLAVEVPSVQGTDLSTGLYILTVDEEVTVGFDAYHCHFDWPARDDDITIDPMAFVAAIVAERVAVASVWAGEQCCGSWLEIDGRKTDDHRYRGPGRRLRIRSWNGKLDRDD